MKELEAEIRRCLEERNWHNLRPADVAKSISIEAAELLEIFQWSNQSLAEVRQDAAKMREIQKELADVLIYCLDMSVLLELDTASIIREKLAVVKEKYPAHLFKDSKVAEPGTEETYLNIKQEYRRRGA
jgi:NTP pyrophosphatase (non-canonical NTP hydrolase)